MKNVDIARVTFDRTKNFSGVVKQQGRVELPSDANEQTAIALRAMRSMMEDLVGPHGGPDTRCGFRVLVHGDINLPDLDEKTKALLKGCEAGDFVLAQGNYYVDGVLCEVHAPFLFAQQRMHRHGLLPEETGKAHLAYLDVWEREVTALDDDSIREVALGGADTAARLQVVWQVRTVTVERSEEAGKTKNTSPDDLAPTWAEHLHVFQPTHRGAMAAHTRRTGLGSNPDLPGDEGSYRGVENQLYRVEIHRGGKASDARGPTFKWSRDNGTVAFSVERYSHVDDRKVDVTLAAGGRDDTDTLSVGDKVEFNEVANDDRDVAGVLFEVVAADIANRSVTLQRPVPLNARVLDKEVEADKDHVLILRRWDHAAAARKKGEPQTAEGAMVLEEGRWLPLEDGIEVKFEPAKGKAVQHYRSGDYWLVPARTVTADVEWPQDGEQPQSLAPHGVDHHYAPLAIIDVIGNETQCLAPLTRRFGFQHLKELGVQVFWRDGD